MITAALALSLPGCTASPPRPSEILVSAAISLRTPLERITTIYHDRHEDVRVRFNFGASGLLSAQVERGAPADVFASASEKFLDELERQGLLLSETRRVIARNRLVVIAPRGMDRPLEDMAALTSLERIAVGNPKTVPAGIYARQCLERLGLWEELVRRLILAENARQILDYAARGEVQAALVYATDAAILPEAIRVVASAPEGCSEPIRYGMAVVTTSRMPYASQAFVDLTVSREGQEVFASAGFLPPQL
ncbi:MAG: molybdate ABC transporter substrate-binding protein [Acidobacteriota bacterium]